MQTNRSVAQNLEMRLKAQIEEVNSRDDFSLDMMDILNESETLDRYVEQIASRVAPELVEKPRRKRRSRSSKSSLSLQAVHSGPSQTASSRSIPQTLTPTVSHCRQEQSRAVQKMFNTRTATSTSLAVAPLFHVPQTHDEELTSRVTLAEDGRGQHEFDAEVHAVEPETSHSNQVGTIISVDENNVAQERYGEWHPEVTHVQGTEETSISLAASVNQKDAAASLDQSVKTMESNEKLDHSRKGKVISQSHTHRGQALTPKLDTGGIVRPHRAKNVASTEDSPRLRGASRDSRSLDTSGPLEPEEQGKEARDERYRPLAPFNYNDLKIRGKWPKGPSN